MSPSVPTMSSDNNNSTCATLARKNSNNNGGDSLLKVPDDVLSLMLSYVDGTSLIRLQRTCVTLHALGDNDAYWYDLCRFQWGISPEHLCKPVNATNKSVYQSALSAIRRLTRQVLEEQCLMSMRMRWQLPNTATTTSTTLEEVDTLTTSSVYSESA